MLDIIVSSQVRMLTQLRHHRQPPCNSQIVHLVWLVHGMNEIYSSSSWVTSWLTGYIHTQRLARCTTDTYYDYDACAV